MAFGDMTPQTASYPTIKEGLLTGVVDLDFVKYTAASVGDRRYITVTHIPTGKEVGEFDGMTEWWGHNGNGGLFKANNDKRVERGLEPRDKEEFEVTHHVEPKEPIENILYTAKTMIERAIEASGAEQVICYYGKGVPDRVERSTLLEYKGTRGMPKPVYLDAVTDYLAGKFNGKLVTGIETDDKVVMECYGKPNYFIIGVDKDYRGADVNYFDVNNQDEGIIDGTGLGELWIKVGANGKNKKVRGRGLMFKLFQVCSQDTVDNYKANCFSDIKWGEMSAYKALVDSTTEKELYENAIAVFKKLYPEPKTITGWKGDTFEIDWLYVMQEMMDMAHMQRWENDRIELTSKFKELGIVYE